MIYLMRHGQDDESFIGGWSSVPLISKGVEDVKEMAMWIKDNLSIQEIVCSDVKRAVDTANIVNEILRVDIRTDRNLREQSKGLLNGMPKEEAKIKYPKYFWDVDIYTVYPQGESLFQLYRRIIKYLYKLNEFNDNTLVVTHRGVINMIYYYLNDIPLDMDKEKFNVTPASVHELDLNKKILRKVR